MSSVPRACLAVLSYDGRELLEACLPTICGQDHEDYDVVVVDNGSSDGTADYLRDRWPDVRVVRLAGNVGVTAALNVMVGAAGDAAYVALLNNDVELEPGWLRILGSVLDERPEVAAAAGKLLSARDRSVIDRAGDELHRSGAAFGRGAGETDHGQFDEAGRVFGVGGAAALYRMAAFEQVGSFDESFFAYLEDVDWNLRARLAGLEAWYEPAALGFHHGGATLGAVNPFSLYHLRRNHLWLVAKNYPAGELVRDLPAVLAFMAAQLAYAVRPGRLGLVLRAYRDALRGLPGVLRRRRTVQRRRTVTAEQLRPYLGHLERPR